MSLESTISQQKYPIKTDDTWENLCLLLRQFGAKTNRNEINLDWGAPEKDQFKLLAKMMNKLTNKNINGAYYKRRKSWTVRVN